MRGLDYPCVSIPEAGDSPNGGKTAQSQNHNLNSAQKPWTLLPSKNGFLNWICVTPG